MLHREKPRRYTTVASAGYSAQPSEHAPDFLPPSYEESVRTAVSELASLPYIEIINAIESERRPEALARRRATRKEKIAARTLSIVSVLFLQPWLTIPAIVFAFKTKNQTKLVYRTSILMSATACAIGLCMLLAVSILVARRNMRGGCRMADLPAALENGYIDRNGTLAVVGSQRPIICNNGFGIVGDRHLTCERFGNWSVLTTTCVDKAKLHRQLGQAAADGNVTEVKRLLDLRYLDVNWRDELESRSCHSIVNATVLHRTTQCNHSAMADVVKLLIGANANVNLRESAKNYTALMLASISGNLETVKLLLAAGADFNTQNSDGMSPLMEASKFGYDYVARCLLLMKGIDTGLQDTRGNTALMWASSYGQVDVIKLILIAERANINLPNHDQWTALTWAALNGRLVAIDVLLNNGANIDVKDRNGWTPLMYAAKDNHGSVVKVLLERRADTKGCDPGEWPLCPIDVNLYKQLGQSAASGNVSEVKRLLGLGYLDVNWRDENEYKDCTHPVKNGTALHRATACNHSTTAEIVKLLLEAGSDINMKEAYDGNLPLFYAALNGNTEVFSSLFRKGADIHAKNDLNNTALNYAIEKGQMDMVQVLVGLGADVNTQRDDGWTPLIQASLLGHLNIVKLLVDKKADINVRSKYGWTALMVAAWKNKQQVVEYLLSIGVNRSGCDHNNWPLCPQ